MTDWKYVIGHQPSATLVDANGSHDASPREANGPERPVPLVPLLLSVERCAEMLSVSRSTLYLLMKRREIPFITIGRLRRIPVAALERFIEQKLREEFPDATV